MDKRQSAPYSSSAPSRPVAASCARASLWR